MNHKRTLLRTRHVSFHSRLTNITPYSQEVEGVQGHDVVEDVVVVHCHAEEEHEEVEPPYHLHKTDETEVSLDIEEGEVAKACHPDV